MSRLTLKAVGWTDLNFDWIKTGSLFQDAVLDILTMFEKINLGYS